MHTLPLPFLKVSRRKLETCFSNFNSIALLPKKRGRVEQDHKLKKQVHILMGCVSEISDKISHLLLL